MKEKVKDLFKIIERTVALTAKVHGVFDADEIFRIVTDELKQAKGYEMALMLLSEDRKEFIVKEITLSQFQIQTIETLIGTSIIGYRRPYECITILHRAVEKRETYTFPTNRFNEQLLDGRLGKVVSLITGHSEKTSTVSPIVVGNQVIGVLGIDTPQVHEFQNFFELAVANLATHISLALQLAEENTLRKYTETELKQSEKSFKSLVDNAPDAIVSIDSNDNVVSWNPAAQTLFGYTKSEILGQPYIKLVPQACREEREQYLKKCKTDGFVQNFQTVRLSKDGELKEVEMTLSSIPQNGAYHTFAFIRDITKRKKVEQELLIRDRAFESINQGILITDPNKPDNPIIFANKAFETLTGYTEAEVLGKNWRLFQGEDTDTETIRAIELAINKEQDFTCEILNYKKDGTPFWNELTLTPIKDSEGKLLNYIGMQTDITERKSAIKQLEDGAFLLQQTHRIAGIGSYTFDFTTASWTSSELLDIMFGITEDYERNIEGWLQLVHPLDKEELRAYLKKAVSTKQTRFDTEYRIVRHNDKEQRWVYGIGELAFDAEGGLVGIKGVIRDITQRREVLDSVNAMAEKFHAVFDSSSAGMIVVADDKGIIQEWNKGAVEAFGYTKEEAIGQDLRMIIPERLRARHDAGFKHALETGGLIHKGLPMELAGLRKDGSEFPLEFAVSMWQSNGNTFFSANMHDITARKLDSARITELSQAVEQSPASVVITDLEGKIKYVNPRFEEVTGFSAQKAIGKTPRILKSGHTSKEEYKRLWKTITSGKTWTGEFHNRRRDGTLYWEKASIGPIFNEEGEITEYLAVKEDITEMKVTQDMLQDTLVHMEELVESRTSELSKAKEALEEIHEDFVSSLQYAKRIQQASLPTDDAFSRGFSNSFVLFRPKDIVSGDFYWLFVDGKDVILSLVDCTGHGVPGALMAMAGNEHLSNVVVRQRCLNPKKILEELDQSVSELLKKRKAKYVMMDGMDLSVVHVDKVNQILQYASAQGHGVLIRDGQTTILSPDKHSIGGFADTESKIFTLQKYDYNKGDRLYLFSDGIYDQFGGPRGKKLLRKNFIQLLADTSRMSMQKQHAHLEQFFTDWLGDNEQIDDVSLVGVEF